MDDQKYIALGKAFEVFLSSERIRIVGTAGLGCTDYQHMGMEVWTKHAGISEEYNSNNKEIIYKYILGMKGVDMTKEYMPTIDDLISEFNK